MAKKLKKSTEKKIPPTAETKARTEGVDFVRSLQLRFIRMIESSSKLIIRGDHLPVKLTIKANVGHATREEGDVNVIGVHLTVEVAGIPQQAQAVDENSSHLLITAHFETQYQTELRPTEDELRSVTGIGLLAGWPNVRELVLSTSSKMGMPPIVLPMAFVDQRTGQISMQGELQPSDQH